MRLIFMGTPESAVPSLRRCVEDGHEVAAVWTQPDRPAGRGNRLHVPPVKEFALGRGLTVHQPVAPDLLTYSHRVAERAISTLEIIDDDEFERGLRDLRAAAEAAPPAVVTTPLGILVFRPDAEPLELLQAGRAAG